MDKLLVWCFAVYALWQAWTIAANFVLSTGVALVMTSLSHTVVSLTLLCLFVWFWFRLWHAMTFLTQQRTPWQTLWQSLTSCFPCCASRFDRRLGLPLNDTAHYANMASARAKLTRLTHLATGYTLSLAFKAAVLIYQAVLSSTNAGFDKTVRGDDLLRCCDAADSVVALRQYLALLLSYMPSTRCIPPNSAASSACASSSSSFLPSADVVGGDPAGLHADGAGPLPRRAAHPVEEALRLQLQGRRRVVAASEPAAAAERPGRQRQLRRAPTCGGGGAAARLPQRRQRHGRGQCDAPWNGRSLLRWRGSARRRQQQRRLWLRGRLRVCARCGRCSQLGRAIAAMSDSCQWPGIRMRLLRALCSAQALH